MSLNELKRIKDLQDQLSIAITALEDIYEHSQSPFGSTDWIKWRNYLNDRAKEALEKIEGGEK